MDILLESPADLDPLMPRLLSELGSRRKIALYGEMGSGKTTLVKAFCRYLGVEGPTASPTFALVNEYSYLNPGGRPETVRHLDLYRLKNIQEAFDIGIEEMLDDPCYCLIEWPEIIEPLFPPGVAKIRMEMQEGNKRLMTVDR